ncbi:hypothetical protein [Sphingosinithalassobacter portus]|uniref:hypothetical protein n=1 Tax=Stakelama portus TaxID=2676234 RepID=UPI0011AB7440|nr:hypothetical protein [Sphingosinithalassobacter portus]
MQSDTPPDDPLHPDRWTAQGGRGGPITGDEFAYLKDLMHRQMGVGHVEPERNWQPPAEPVKPRGAGALLRRLWPFGRAS